MTFRKVPRNGRGHVANDHVEKDGATVMMLRCMDNHDRDGYEVRVLSGSTALSPHHLWVIEFVHWRESRTLAQLLLMRITPARVAKS